MDRVAKRVQKDARNNIRPSPEYSESMLHYWEHCTVGHCTSTQADIAFTIYEDQTQKEILESLLLSECPDQDIIDAFLVPQNSIEIYKELFFDVKYFRTKLDKISYLENYSDSFGKELKIRAVNLGYEYVLYTYADIVPKTSAQKQLVQRMFMSAAYKAMSMNYNGITSSTTKQAIEHGKLMLKAYETLTKINSEDVSDAYDLTRIIPSAPQQDAASTMIDFGEII